MGAVSKPLLESIKANIVNPLLNILLALAVVVFLWGVFDYVVGGGKMIGEPGKQTNVLERGKQHIVWGLVGLFIMISAIGIVNLILHLIGY
jgi:hypothetical protein